MEENLHPIQKLSIKIGMMLAKEEPPMNIALGALSTLLIAICKEEGMSKAEILNKIGNNIDTVEGNKNESGYR